MNAMYAEQAVEEFAHYALPELRKAEQPIQITDVDTLYNKWRKHNRVEVKDDISKVLYGFIDRFLKPHVTPLDKNRMDSCTTYSIR
jgi:hypothetical protein